ncbi:hypothetical protein [Neptuniibacter sp. QD34_54]|uniref:hypothetical protein n=1 Tax=Neptuniibacter sp. QD34_54 TaxID=3398208 RepID=UPI0039F5CBDC
MISGCIENAPEKLRINRVDFANDLVVAADRFFVMKPTGWQNARIYPGHSSSTLYYGKPDCPRANRVRVYDKAKQLIETNNRHYPVCFPVLDAGESLIRIEFSLKFALPLASMESGAIDSSRWNSNQMPNLRRHLELLRVFEWSEVEESLKSLPNRKSLFFQSTASSVWKALRAKHRLWFAESLRREMKAVPASARAKTRTIWDSFNSSALSKSNWKDVLVDGVHQSLEQQLHTEIYRLWHAVTPSNVELTRE